MKYNFEKTIAFVFDCIVYFYNMYNIAVVFLFFFFFIFLEIFPNNSKAEIVLQSPVSAKQPSSKLESGALT